ncbi:MAG: EAL domain-containing protein, partial [Xanthomonadaceae bacterium]|nr:EAL domain-containing protein [Xanthomonadaceae bacterium]
GLFLQVVAETLKAPRSALLYQQPSTRELVCIDARGFAPDAAVVLGDAPAHAQFQEFIGTPLCLWAFDEPSGFALVLGGNAEDGDHLTPADRELAEAALDVFTNIIERKRAEQRMLHDAFHDSLTGLPNRTLFLEHLEQAMARAQRSSGYLFSVLFIDVDRFKVVNDSLGHAVGDELLIAFGQRLRQTLRAGDVLARLGSDEFAVLADDLAELGDAIRLAERIRTQVQQPFNPGAQQVFLTASTGIARNAVRYESAADLLRDADIAMYRAKASGGGRHRMFDADMHAAMVERMQVETDLHRAVDDGELRLVYQPIVDVTTGALSGFEALMRWRHPVRGLVMPSEFIAVAEDTGMIVPMGRWMIGEVCRRLATINRGRKQPLSISVNLSDKEFLQPGLVDAVADALRANAVAPELLHLELTERMLLAHARMETEILPRLKELGVRVMIDDFGTGYSSLSRLARLPIDALKIDYSFIRELVRDGGSSEIVRAIVALAHNLGISVVAEGVEREEQLALLREIGCDRAQGFLFSRPLDDRRVAPVLLRECWFPV